MLGRGFRQRRGDTHPRDAARSHLFIEDKQTLWREGLRTREQQQYLIGNPARLTAPLRITRIDREVISIENLTDENLPFVFARDGYDGYYILENLPARGKGEAYRASTDAISGVLTRIRAQHMQDVPDGVRQLGRWTAIDDQKSVSEVLDRIWNECLNEDAASEKLQPYGYVTLLKQFAGTHKPIKAEQEQGQYLVIGRSHW